MEYEIENEGEDWLFDDSTNPSLKPETDRAISKEPPRRPEDDPADTPADRPKLQKAELIPEEEDEHQLA